MSLWKVRVQCLAADDINERYPYCYMTALVDEETSMAAMFAGKKCVEDNAPSDTKWLEFTAMEASRVQLPVLTDLI